MFSVFFLKSFYLAIFHLWRHIARDFQLTYIYPTVLSVVLKIRTRSTWRIWTDSRDMNIFVQLFKYFCPCGSWGRWLVTTHDSTLLQLALGHGLAGLLLPLLPLLLLGPHCLLHGHRSPAPVCSLLRSSQRRLPAAAAKLSIVMVRI